MDQAIDPPMDKAMDGAGKRHGGGGSMVRSIPMPPPPAPAPPPAAAPPSLLDWIQSR